MLRLHIVALPGPLALLAVVAACSSGDQHGPRPSTPVTGVLQLVGGPAPGAPRPMVGDITIYRGRNPSGPPVKALRTDANGHFQVDLAPGTFFFVGRSSSVSQMACTSSGPITLTSAPVSVAVNCSVP